MVHVVWSGLSVGFLALYVAFSISQALSNGAEDIDGCENVQPIYGGALLHHVYQTLKVPGSIYCLRACDDDIRCQSINHVVHGEICELNNRTKEARPEAFTTDDTKVYMKKFRKKRFPNYFQFFQYVIFSQKSLLLSVFCGVAFPQNRFYRFWWSEKYQH